MPTDKDLTLQRHNIEDELWREYDWGGRVYRIEHPKMLVYRPGGSTHRIVGPDRVVHCVPAPGIMGCVLRWYNPEQEDPVNF